MAKRTLVKDKPDKQKFFDDIISAVATPKVEVDYDEGDWREKPVTLQEFCTVWLDESLFPKQLEFGEAMTGLTPMSFDVKYDEGHCFWGKGSGKDRTIAKLQLYVVYKLMCLRNPQRFLRENYSASIADGDNIDLANMSINSRQAENVYFKKFKSLILKCNNPHTKRNWFSENGVDIRDGYDLQTVEVTFPHNITAHSLNSETHTGEGLSPIFVTIDEFGAFKADRAFDLLDAVRDSVLSRFPGVGKVAVISYKYYNNDPMDVLYKKEVNEERTYSSKAATFEVNTFRKKSDFAKKYRTNPEKAKMTYECEGGETEGGFVSKKYMLDYMFDPKYANPYPREVYAIESDLMLNTPFSDDFRGSDGVMYCCHADLASGKENNDYVGFALGHVATMMPKIDSKLRKDLASEGIYLDVDDTTLEYSRKGVVIDLALQIRAKSGGEVQLSTIRNFIKLLKNKYNLNILYSTFDGWQCFSGDTKIKLLNGNDIRIDEIKKPEWVYSYDLNRKRIVPQLCKPSKKTGDKVPILEIEIDNGEKIRCTHNHPFLMRDGSYKKAGELKKNDSLMPLYTRDKKLGGKNYYERIYQNDIKKWEFTHRRVIKEKTGRWSKNSKNKNIESIHHKDFNHRNNTPDNLEYLTVGEHMKKHRDDGIKIRWEKPGAREKQADIVRERNKRLNLHLYLTPPSEEDCKKISNSVKKLWENDEYRKKQVEAHKGNQGYWLGKKRSDEVKKKISETKKGTISWNKGKKLVEREKRFCNCGCGESKIVKVTEKWSYFRGHYKKYESYNNHKVVSIKDAGYEDVYDIEVPEFHNFALSAGVFVHNSTDSIQQLNEAGIESWVESVDKKPDAYTTWKELMYQQLVKCYPHPIALREAKELIVDDKGKIDHPELSYEREIAEGRDDGSKDVIDAIAAVTKVAYEKFNLEPDIFLG